MSPGWRSSARLELRGEPRAAHGTRSHRKPRRPWVQLILVPVLFYLGAKLSLAFAVMPEVLVMLWIPNSILLATLLHYHGRRAGESSGTPLPLLSASLALPSRLAPRPVPAGTSSRQEQIGEALALSYCRRPAPHRAAGPREVRSTGAREALHEREG
jgi:hypothetical protein